MPAGRDLLLDPKETAIEMHVSADLEKVFVWLGRRGHEPLYCVFKHSLTLWEVLFSLRPC